MGQGDSKAVINQCLNCTVPADYCNGRYPACPGNGKKPIRSSHGSKIKMIQKMIKKGMRRNEIRKEMDISSNELGSFIAVLLKTGRITKEEAINSREK